MSCAGYLLLNNYKVVYVTLENGILTCTDIPRRPEEEGEEREEEKEERNIPIEEDNKNNSSMDINKRKRHVLNKNRVSFERIFPLSEYLLEILENEEEFDSASSPYSFQVSKFTVYHDDSNGNEMIRFVDSLILSACDQDAKNLWVQYIRNWSRFGWQKTRFVHAEDKYRAFLLRQLKEQASLNIQEKPSPPTSSKSSSSSSGGGSASGRRRFYRIATRTINMTNHVSSSSWFHARVTRVNVGG